MPAKKPRRTTNEPITVYLPPADLEALRALRDRSGVPVAVMVRRAVKATLATTTAAVEALTTTP
ncbi:MAG: ribbon-helix-helix protein, CopG family [Anaeromyxobacter sp.]|nr:ribbon-helix-helix protein, CopG family [Anaeromyxobacter sp.]